MFDHIAVHIHDPKGSVRSIFDAHGTEPRIATSDKLGLGILLRADRRPCCPVPLELEPRNQVMHGLAYQCIIAHLVALAITAIDDGAARRGEAVDCVQIIKAVCLLADWENRWNTRRIGDQLITAARRCPRSLDPCWVDDVMKHRKTVLVPEPVPPIVGGANVLGYACLQAHLP